MMMKYLEKSYQENIQPRCCINGEIRSMTENIGGKWREIGDSGRKICSLGTTKIHS